jgi:hypothetical protein
MGLPLSPEEEKSSTLVKEKIYKNVIFPILEGAVKEGDIQMVPSNASDIIEIARPLRAKDGLIKPIIARFYSRETSPLTFATRRHTPRNRQMARTRATTSTPSLRI